MANAKTEFYLTCNNRESENVVTDMIGREGWPTPWRGLPGASGPSKCEGTIEDHRNIALDVHELTRKQVFEQPVGTVFRSNLAFPWLRVMRLNLPALWSARLHALLP